MKNGLFRICSMIMVIVLLVNMLPLQAMAQQLNTGRVEQTEIQPIHPETEVSPERTGEEILQKRTEYSKEFLLEDGLHMVNVYPEAVHYATENGWEEIDNTLIAKADGTITNTAGVWDVSFPLQLSKDKSISIKKDGYTLSFFMAGEITGGNALIRSSDASATAEQVTVTGMQKSVAAIEPADLSDKQASASKQAMPQKAYSRLTYANVYQNADVIYDLQSNKVKESLVLESYNSALRGYRYTLDVGTMIPVLEESGEILFYGKEGDVVFVMPAPYMIDNAGEYNEDIQVDLTGSGSRYTLTYRLPRQWLAAEERTWPVILDPEVRPSVNTTNVQDRSIAENAVFSQTGKYNSCGYSDADGRIRFLLQYNALPALTASDVIVSASAAMNSAGGTTGPVPVYVHKVRETWNAGSITWEDMPDWDETIEDYAIIDTNADYRWDVTDIVRGWYDGENTGMLFKCSEDVENGGVHKYKRLYSSNYTDVGKPVLSIIFRNNNGLESYWDYTSASAGRAGTGYINNYTGNLVWVREDMGFGGNRMPVSISHIYNANDAASNQFGMGNGWRINYNQRVYQWLGSNQLPYYAWEDGDGTIHYFWVDENGEYKDEDGLGLTLTDTGLDQDRVYTITDRNGNSSYFDSRGCLFRIENNQETPSSIDISYYADTEQIQTITDGSGRKYHFKYEYEYNYTKMLSEIYYVGTGDEEIYCTTYEYTGANLTCIYDNEADYSEYSYGTNNLLTAVEDSVGYSLNYTYSTMTANRPARVSIVEEKHNNQSAGRLTFAYTHNQTAVADRNGNTLIYQFNNFGNTISVQDDEGHAQYYKYATDEESETGQSPEEARRNQLTLSSKLQNTVGNMLNDSSFENSTLWYTAGSGVSVSFSTTQVYYGNQSHWVYTTQAATGIHEQTYTVGPNETVTFSAYVKTGTAAVALSIYDWNGFTATEIQAPNTHWTRLEVSYTNNTSAPKNICPHILSPSAGTFWVDCVQMERSPTASRYNLVENGDFRYGGSSWSSATGIYQDVTSAPQLEDTVYAISGSPTEERRLTQTVQVAGESGDSFIFSGWAKGNSAPLYKKNNGSGTPQFALQMVFNYTDGSPSEPFTSQFNPDSDTWQYATVHGKAEQDYSSVTVQLIYAYNVNEIYCDGFQLFKEEFAVRYKYDKNENLKLVTDLQKKDTQYYYDDNNDLRSVTESNGAVTTYEYDDYHNVVETVTPDGLTYTYAYDDYGNNTSVSTTVGGVTMSTSSTYSADGNRLLSTTDALGEVTTYGYNVNTGLLEWVQYPEDTPATRTNYAYDGILRLEEVYAETDTGDNMSAYYYYEGDLVGGIQTYGAEYSFNRGDFGLLSRVRVGDYALATYYYTEDGNYFLEGLAYGNGGMIHYNYDEKGRLIGESNESDEVSTYAYNNDGQLAVVTHLDITTKYYYDLIGRMVKQEEKGTGYSHTVQQTYNEVNNLASLQETINGITHSSEFDYDEYDRVESIENRVVNNQTQVTNDVVSEHYSYDGFGRMNESVTKDDGTNVLTESYTFTAPTPNATSGQIATNRLQANGYDVTYSYTYDGNGNILSISDGTYTTSYVYDSANQLLRENNQAGDFTHTWEYDPAGNILNRKEYAYTTGALGTPIDTVTYSYDDYTWGDLLTGYDGQSISHDEIGNPVFDGTWDYCWAEGRELCVMVFNGEDGYYLLWEFTYDVNGMRTKRRCEDGTIYQYVYNGSSLSQMTVGNNTLYFAYGANGAPMSVTYNGTTYYYVTNIQGDIIAILNAAGTPVVHYSYDAWGNPISTTGTMASSLGALNPLRYRGYVYDQETGLYYLQSRYYNPQWGRFISADGVMSEVGGDVRGYNLFAYCMNNPVNMSDSSGDWPKWMENAANWLNKNIVVPVVDFFKGVSQDVKNYDVANQSEEKVLESNYFSSYRGVPVIRTNGDRSGSFGAIFLTRETNNRSNPEDIVRHEYGHTKQLEQLGVINYALCIGLPSWRQWGTGEYYSKPWEITADIYGGVKSRNHAQSNINRGFAYLEGSKRIGPLIWIFIK